MLQAAIALGSVGEFALVLVGKAMALGVFDTQRQQFFLIVTALSMAMAPLLMRFSARFPASWKPCGFQTARAGGKGSAHSVIPTLHGHAIICGYGPVGRRMDEALRRAGVETVVVELNVDTVKELKSGGSAGALFADAAQSETLPLAGIDAGAPARSLSRLRDGQSHHRACPDLDSDTPIFCRVKFDKERVEGLRRPVSRHRAG